MPNKHERRAQAERKASRMHDKLVESIDRKREVRLKLEGKVVVRINKGKGEVK